MLDAARTIQLAQRNGSQDDLIFAVNNLARAKLGLGNYEDARPLFMEALNATLPTNHRLRAPILTDLADLECRTKRYEAGLARLDEARPIMAARYTEDPWRVALVDNVKGGCLLGLKRFKEAEPLLARSAPVILKKWKPDMLYGYDVTQRTVRLHNMTAKE
jgi:tetratricopeptide (TPR) repeat protein